MRIVEPAHHQHGALQHEAVGMRRLAEPEQKALHRKTSEHKIETLPVLLGKLEEPRAHRGAEIFDLMLRVASGEPLDFGQEAVELNGHAIECRIYCEESDGTFLPAVGTVKVLNIPDVPGIRFDGGIALNQTITAAFDPMAGKLICHGTNRNAAINLCERGLDEIVLLGVNNNIDYLRGILKHEAFKAGLLHTEFIKEHASTLIPDGPNDSEQTALLIAAALDVDSIRTLIFDTPEPYASIGRWQN